LHLSPVLKKTLGILCVALLCASSAVARTGKKSSHKQAATASTRTHSTRTASAAHKRSKAESSEDKPDKVARGKSRSKSKSSSRHASKRKAAPETDEDAAPASRKSSKSSKADRTTKVVSVSRPRGQQGIDGDRAREIQEALIREHYLDGDASGIWDARTRDAMVRFQNDNGWQTRIVPDSRALIKLGLGPKHAGLLNPEAVSESIPNAARETRPGGGLPQ
jgi:flagellar biosynthesis GTPase FlhF